MIPWPTASPESAQKSKLFPLFTSKKRIKEINSLVSDKNKGKYLYDKTPHHSWAFYKKDERSKKKDLPWETLINGE